MTALASDPSLYIHRDIASGKFHGLSGYYIDYIIRFGRSEFKPIATAIPERFDMGNYDVPPPPDPL